MRRYPQYLPWGTAKQCKEPVSFFATSSWFVDHIRPIHAALPPERKGEFCTKRFPRGTGPIVVAAYSDLRRISQTERPIILAEHGVGLSYAGRHVSYAGGIGERKKVSLFLCVNAQGVERNLKSYRRAATAIIGCPKLDNFPIGKLNNEPPVIAVGFHWNCSVCPEARNVLLVYRKVLPELAKKYHIIGTGHPHDWETVFKPLWQSLGVEPVESFEEVVRRADLFVCDNSSTIYEFAYTDRPVLVLNAPYYRRWVHHGLRFWEAIPGLQCHQSQDLLRMVEEALSDPPEAQELRRIGVETAYPVRGNASQTAVQAILNWQDSIK